MTAAPSSAGSAPISSRNASTPPAEAPTTTMSRRCPGSGTTQRARADPRALARTGPDLVEFMDSSEARRVPVSGLELRALPAPIPQILDGLLSCLGDAVLDSGGRS